MIEAFNFCFLPRAGSRKFWERPSPVRPKPPLGFYAKQVRSEMLTGHWLESYAADRYPKNRSIHNAKRLHDKEKKFGCSV